MGRPKKIEDAVRVSTLISKKQHEWLKYLAIQMSQREKRQITPCEAIRMAIEAAYPPPKNMQLDMF